MAGTVEERCGIYYKGKLMGGRRAIRTGPNGTRYDFAFENYDCLHTIMVDAHPQEQVDIKGLGVTRVWDFRETMLRNARQITLKAPR